MAKGADSELQGLLNYFILQLKCIDVSHCPERSDMEIDPQLRCVPFRMCGFLLFFPPYLISNQDFGGARLLCTVCNLIFFSGELLHRLDNRDERCVYLASEKHNVCFCTSPASSPIH